MMSSSPLRPHLGAWSLAALMAAAGCAHSGSSSLATSSPSPKSAGAMSTQAPSPIRESDSRRGS